MDFKKLVEQTLNESPDEIGFRGKGYRYDEPEGNPRTFFITPVSVRKDFKKGYKSDVPSNLGMCIVHCPTVMGSDVIDKAYLEDPENKNWTHFNFSSLLIYNKAYSLEDLRGFGFEVFSLKSVDADRYFDRLKTVYPRLAFTLTKDNDEIALKFRGRFWKIGKKFVVSLWYFDKDVVRRYLIPFFKSRYGVGEDDVIFETYQEDKDQEDARMVPGSKIVGVAEAKPYEKEIAQLLSQLHIASGDESKKNQIKNKLFEIFAKHGLNPASYGFSEEEEVAKGSLMTARKIAGSEPMAKVRSLERTSESLFFSNGN